MSAVPTVGAVIVTYRRPEVLRSTLDAVAAQDLLPKLVVVVDNDAENGPDGVARLLEDYPKIDYLPTTTNVGFSAGLALGMQHLRQELDPDCYWLLDDDSPPGPRALAMKVEVLATAKSLVGVVAGEGGHVGTTRIRHDLRVVVGSPEKADFTLIDGALVTSQAVGAAGYPRSDLFIMLEDFEYTTRIASHGFDLVVHATDETDRLHMGSTAAWRGYYQSRNLLRVGLDRRSPHLVLIWIVREIKITITLLARRSWERLRFRMRGTAAALRNQMGRGVTPC